MKNFIVFAKRNLHLLIIKEDAFSKPKRERWSENEEERRDCIIIFLYDQASVQIFMVLPLLDVTHGTGRGAAERQLEANLKKICPKPAPLPLINE